MDVRWRPATSSLPANEQDMRVFYVENVPTQKIPVPTMDGDWWCLLMFRVNSTRICLPGEDGCALASGHVQPPGQRTGHACLLRGKRTHAENPRPYYGRGLVVFAYVSRKFDANLPAWGRWMRVGVRPRPTSRPTNRTCVAFTWKTYPRRKSPSIVGTLLVRVLYACASCGLVCVLHAGMFSPVRVLSTCTPSRPFT